MIRWSLAALHVLALGIGLGAIWARGRALSGELDPAGLRRVFYADNWWAVAALLWVSTGVVRAFGGFEKGTFYYLHNHLFWTKMLLLVVILVLEARIMMRLILWRRAVGRGERPNLQGARSFARVSFVQAGLVIGMMLAATAMARGYGVAP
jgi:putative membrane protein